MVGWGRAGWKSNSLNLLKIAIPTIGLGACVGLIGEALNGTVLLAQWTGAHQFSWLAWGRGFALVLLATLGFASWLYQKLPAELPLRSLSRPARPEPHPVLILLVSTPLPVCRLDDDTLVFVDKSGTDTHHFTITSDIVADKAALQQKALAQELPRWNWQQQLHALALHLPRLERVYLIGSAGPGGSHAHLETFAQLVRVYCGEIPVVWDEGIDFEDIEAIYRRALKFIAEAEQQIDRVGQRFRQEDIMIDATGGFKTASIAAGLVTLHNRVKFQYVNNSGQVVAYAMIYEPHRTLG